ncbi:MAG: type I-E CRISPR-associated protein Cse1/CasA [Planctomycetes bacterium]|nr:type I-E CRISPR-associated protein Cse1/CasA [Planctomycetota bacterium]
MESTKSTADQAFNLIDEPWIHVIWRKRPDDRDFSGNYRHVDKWRSEVGIRDALKHAVSIREAYDTSPLVTFGIHRLLLAILHAADVHGDNADISHGADQYLTTWGHRFDLFGSQYPFLQRTSLRGKLADKSKRKAAATLFAELAKGTNIAHFSHMCDESTGLTPAECAHGLLLQSSHPGNSGKGFKDAINGSTPVYLFPSRCCLFETLAANLHAQPRQNRDAPIWENGPGITGDVGYLQGLFWPARFVLLQAPEDGFVKLIVYDQGIASKDVNEGPATKRNWDDPHAAKVRPKSQKKNEWTRLLAAKPMDARGDWHTWRQILEDIARNGWPSAVARLELAVFIVIAISHDGKAKFYNSARHSFSIPISDAARTEPGQFITILETWSEKANNALWANNPKRKANRETFRPYAGFDVAEFENVLRERYFRGDCPDDEKTKEIAIAASSGLRRVNGLPWREIDIDSPSAIYPNDDSSRSASAIDRFLRRLADRKRVRIADIDLLRQANSGGADSVALTDLLNEHVRDKEFKGIRRQTAWMIARLFSLDPKLGASGNFGGHLRSLLQRGAGDSVRRANKRLEREFEYLLHTPADQLEAVLSMWITRLRRSRRSSQNVPLINWTQLYLDVNHWNDDTKDRWRAQFERRRRFEDQTTESKQ